MSWEHPTAAWWRDHWISVCVAGYFVLMIAHGAIGFVLPSPSITDILHVGTMVYSGFVTVFGVLGILSVLRGHRRSEAIIVVCMAGLTLVHGTLLFLAGQGGVQTGIRLAAAPMMMIPFAVLRTRITVPRRTFRTLVGDDG